LYVEIVKRNGRTRATWVSAGTRRDLWKVSSSECRWAQPAGSVDSEGAHSEFQERTQSSHRTSLTASSLNPDVKVVRGTYPWPPRLAVLWTTPKNQEARSRTPPAPKYRAPDAYISTFTSTSCSGRAQTQSLDSTFRRLDITNPDVRMSEYQTILKPSQRFPDDTTSVIK
jgi:hypothetical protein